MTTPSIPDLLTMTAAGLTALSDAPLWMALAIALPPALTAAARGINEILTGIARFRMASMQRRQTNRILNEIADLNAALQHLERTQTNAALATAAPPADPAPSTPSPAGPPAAPP